MLYKNSSRAVKNASLNGAITLQKMIFLEKLFYFFFSLSEYKP